MNVRVVETCVGDRLGDCQFEERCRTTAGHISAGGNLTVKMVSLDDLFTRGEIPAPNFIKIDAEGAELMVLRGARGLITEIRPMILYATHSDELDQACSEFMAAFGYELHTVTIAVDKETLATP